LSSRAEKRRALRDERKAKKRAQKVATKHIRRRTSVRGRLKLHDETMAGLLLQLRQFVSQVQQHADVVEIILTVLVKQALGQELSEEDRDVLEDFIERQQPGPGGGEARGAAEV